ncbi:HypC/HybG/HupF family hydrogenase formation chaperone [Deltaproteobacteria bacterium TL4]
MCLGIPMKVVAMDPEDPDLCWVEEAGTKRPCFIGLLEDVVIGEYVLLHAGFAIEKLDEKEALYNLELLSQLQR